MKNGMATVLFHRAGRIRIPKADERMQTGKRGLCLNTHEAALSTTFSRDTDRRLLCQILSQFGVSRIYSKRGTGRNHRGLESKRLRNGS